MRRILCPTDFSEGAHRALDHALELARLHDAQLQVLHVVVMHDHDPHQPSHYLPDPAATRTRLQERAETAMRTALEELGAEGVAVETVHRRGLSASEVILDYLEEVETDLVVLGTPRRRGSRPLRLGSVTHDVVRRAPCSVLTVRESPTARPPVAWQQIVVALDLSPHSEAVIQVAANVLPPRATLHLVHVIAPLQPPVPPRLAEFSLEVLEAQQREAARSSLLRFSAAIDDQHHPLRMHALIGQVAVSLLDFAEDRDADLIVIGAQGHGSRGRFPLGSMAERVARNATCPVLTVRPPTWSSAADRADP